MSDAKAVISVVDDDPSVRKALGRLIRTAGYDATVYESAEDFLIGDGIIRSGCVILDVHLPGMSGLDLQARILQSVDTIPVVFISAFNDENARSRAIETGAIDFLPKPLDTDQLLAVIERALSKW